MARRKRLTEAQIDSLRPYEKNMETAVRSDWTRGLRETGLRLMAAIKKEIEGGSTYVDMACNVCCLNLVRTVARWYFEDTVDEVKTTSETKAPAKKRGTPKKA